MEQGSGKWAHRKEVTAGWISGHPLTSVVATGVMAFSIGLGAGGPAVTQDSVSSQPAAAAIDSEREEVADLQAELEGVEDRLTDATDDASGLRKDNSSLERRLSSKSNQVRKLKGALADTKAALREAKPQPVAAVQETAPSNPGCDPNYSGACVPIVSYDLNCDDISGSVTVVGSDPHGFDGDGDGHGCE